MSSIALREPSAKILAKRDTFITQLIKQLGADNIISDEIGRRVYSADAFAAYRQTPLAVVLPQTNQQVIDTVKFCNEHDIKIVPRGAGTSVSGCAMAYEDAVVLCLSRMNKILQIDYDNRTITAQAGITNLALTQAVAAQGFFYAPDPSSQVSSTLGGNIGTNAGGAQCFKYGVTSCHVLGMKVVTAEGEMLTIGGAYFDGMGYDIRSLIVGSEGQLGIVTEATVRILPKPERSRPILLGFASHDSAGACVASIVRSRLTPVAIEFMDRTAIQVCEEYAQSGYPLNVEAMLIIEVEGSETEIAAQLEMIQTLSYEHFPIATKVSQNDAEAAAIWKGRKSAYSALGKLAQTYVVDGTIPTSKLADVLPSVLEICRTHRLRVANIFHAGDGNLHPILLYNADDADEFARVEQAVAKILKLCVDVGGCLSGEHGIGIEKRDLMPLQFHEDDLEQQKRLKDAFDEKWVLNPGKVLPLHYQRQNQD